MEKYNNILNFYREYIKMEEILRKGWVMRNVPAKRLESVADHTLQLIMLASVITKELDIKLDNHKLTEMLLVHDVGEIIVGDVSEVEDNYDGKKSKENEAVKSIFNSLSEESGNYYYLLWIEMENRSTPLAKFAYLIDKIDAVIKAGIYEERYNIKGLFNEFYGFQKQKKNFSDTELEEFIEFLYNTFQ